MSFFLILAYLSISASITALFTLIIASFRSGDTDADQSTQYIKRSSRTIKANFIEPTVSSKGANVRITALIWSVLAGQIVGLFLLLFYVESPESVRTLLRTNGYILIFATLLCSFLTMLNGWFEIKMKLWFRIIFQAYSFLVGGLLLSGAFGKKISIRNALEAAGGRLLVIIIAFFLTAVFAFILMFANGAYRDSENLEYDFNTYFRIVIIVGMVIGVGLLFVRYLLL